MTVTTATVAKYSYNGNGSTTVFSFPRKFAADNWLKVVERNNTTGAETVKTLTTDYTVSGAGNEAGGSVTMLTAPASGVTLVISYNVPRTQGIDYVENDPFPADTHEEALDKLTIIAQEQDETIARTLRFPLSDSSSLSGELPSSTERANKYLSFDANGEPQVQAEVTSGVYYGPDASDPATRPDGSASVAGDLYYNTTSGQLKVFSGSSWSAGTFTVPLSNTFTGDGVTTVFSLSADPGSENAVIVTWDGVVQHRSTYSVSGSGLAFSAAPGSGVAVEVTILGVAMSFGVPADLSVTTDKLADDTVTYAKLQNVSATSRILGRKTASAGDMEECTLSEILDFIGSAAQGDILYRGASGWERLAAGSEGQALYTGGAGANPSWSNSFKVSNFSRDTSLATGTQAVTGVGFKPRAIIFLAVQGSTKEMSVGFSDGSSHGALYQTSTAGTFSAASSAIVDDQTSGSDSYLGTVASFDADGFTISWTRTGAPTGTLTIYYLALR